MTRRTKAKIAHYTQGFIFGVITVLALLMYQIVLREMESKIISPLPAIPVVYKYIEKPVYVSPAPSVEPVKAQVGIKAIITQVFADEGSKVIEQAVTIAFCESSLDPNKYHWNTNGSVDTGLFQINSVHGYGFDYLKDPWNNAQVAHRLFKQNYWQPWYSSHRCHGL